MQLEAIHQQVDEKLAKIDNEIERFQSNIQSCDDPEQRALLEKDLTTLEVIRDKLIKARGLTQQVSDLRHQVETPQSSKSDSLLSSPILAVGVLGCLLISLILGWLIFS